MDELRDLIAAYEAWETASAECCFRLESQPDDAALCGRLPADLRRLRELYAVWLSKVECLICPHA